MANPLNKQREEHLHDIERLPAMSCLRSIEGRTNFKHRTNYLLHFFNICYWLLDENDIYCEDNFAIAHIPAKSKNVASNGITIHTVLSKFIIGGCRFSFPHF